MAYSAPIAIGSLNWGTPVNDTFADLDTRVKALSSAQASAATDQASISWTFDPATDLNSSILVSGTVNMAKVWVRQPTTINNVTLSIVTAGSGLTAAQNLAGLYDAAGNRVGVTVDQTAAWASTGLKDMPLTVPYVAAAGAYYVAFLSNGTTPPAFARGSNLAAATTVNLGLTATTARFTTGPLAQTSLPTTVTMGSRTADARAWWAAVK